MKKIDPRFAMAALALATLPTATFGQQPLPDQRSTIVPVSQLDDATRVRLSASVQNLQLTGIENITEGGQEAVLRVGNLNSLSVFALPTETVEQTSAELVERIKTERRSNSSALSYLRNTLKDRKPLVFETQTGWASAAAGVLVSYGQARKPAVNDAFSLSLERARSAGLRVNLAQLQLLPDPARVEAAGQRSAALAKFSVEYRKSLGWIAAMLDAPETPAHRNAAVRQAEVTFDSFVENWPAYETDAEARSIAVKALAALSRQSELKSVYGVMSNFAPESYRRIFAQSDRAALITDNLGNPVCAGLAVTHEWILTAGHCFVGRSHQDMSVRLSVGGGGLGPRLAIDDAWPSPPRGSRTTDALDFAFIRIGSSAASAPEPLCVRSSPAYFQEPVLVIAYDGDDRLVYDHAYVWYPYQVREPEFKRVAAMTGIRLQHLSEAFYPSDPVEQTRFFSQNMQAFRKAYETRVGAGDDSKNEYRIKPLGASVVRPAFGFDTDTRHGNSGAPVFSRSSGCLLGVFTGGQPDGVVISESSWREHEFGTPATAVLSEIRVLGITLSQTATDPTTVKRRELVAALDAVTVAQ